MLSSAMASNDKGYLLNKPCPPLDVEMPSEVTTTCSSPSHQGIQSPTESRTDETEIGKYQGKVLSYFCSAAACHGSIACSDVKGGIVQLNSRDIIGLEPAKCKTSKGKKPAGPAVTFDIYWKRNKPQAVNVRLLLDELAVSDQATAPEPAPLTPATELHEIVERLRRVHGVSSTSFHTSPCANRIGAPEAAMRYFLLREQGSKGGQPVGYITYVEHTLAFMTLRVVVDDPVCAAADLRTILQDFITDCDLARVCPMFPCVKADVAATLRQQGLSTTMFGAEFALPLRTFELSTRQRNLLRTASDYGLECCTTCKDLDELARMNEAWLANRPCTKEVVLMTLPPSIPQTAGANSKGDEVRRIFAYQHGCLVGFMEAEPYYCDGKIIGYVLNSTRFLPNPKPSWIPELMFATLVETLKSEGRAEHLAFGFSPCTELQPHDGEVKWLRSLFEAMWDSGEDDIYSIHGLARKKKEYYGDLGVRCQDKFIAMPRTVEFNATVRFLLLLFGADAVKKSIRKRWYWSWLLSSMIPSMAEAAVPEKPQIVCESLSCCKDISVSVDKYDAEFS